MDKNMMIGAAALAAVAVLYLLYTNAKYGVMAFRPYCSILKKTGVSCRNAMPAGWFKPLVDDTTVNATNKNLDLKREEAPIAEGLSTTFKRKFMHQKPVYTEYNYDAFVNWPKDDKLAFQSKVKLLETEREIDIIQGKGSSVSGDATFLSVDKCMEVATTLKVNAFVEENTSTKIRTCTLLPKDFPSIDFILTSPADIVFYLLVNSAAV